MTTSTLLQQIKNDTKKILRHNLVGIYLHGSFVLGGYNPDFSDLDFLIVVKYNLTKPEKLALMAVVLEKWWPNAPKKGLEFHVMTVKMLQKSPVTAAFDFHFSPLHRRAFLKSPEHFVEAMQGLDPDLPAHLKIIRKKGYVLLGKSTKKTIPYISKESYWRSVCADLQDVSVGIRQAPVSTLLNLCRSLAFVKRNLLLGKLAGGRWALHQVSPEFQKIIEQAIIDYQGNFLSLQQNYSEENLQEITVFLLSEIKKAAGENLLFAH